MPMTLTLLGELLCHPGLVNEEFTEFDEYVQASLEDFLNLHNGLYNAVSYTHLVRMEPDVLRFSTSMPSSIPKSAMESVSFSPSDS